MFTWLIIVSGKSVRDITFSCLFHFSNNSVNIGQHYPEVVLRLTMNTLEIVLYICYCYLFLLRHCLELVLV